MAEQKQKTPKSFWALYGKYIAIIAAALILIILIVVLAGAFSKKASPAAETESGSVLSLISESSGSGGAADSLMGLKVDAYPEVNALVQKYFDAKKNCDAEALNKIVDFQTDKTAEDLEMENQFVEDYQDIKCYSSPGLDEGSYVVYVYYRIKFASIETTAPSLIRLYICTNADQSLYIYGKTPNGELKSFIDEMDSSEDVRILIATVNKELKEACGQDEDLARLQDMLKNGSGSTSPSEDFEVTAAAETPDASSGTAETEASSTAAASDAEASDVSEASGTELSGTAEQ